jgi:uncharacterized protein
VFPGDFVTNRALTTTQLDLRTVTASEIPIRRTFTAAELHTKPEPDAEDLRILGDVRFDGVLQKKDQRFRLKGRVQATLELTCGRCAEPFAWPVDTEVDLTYVPQPSGGAHPADPDVELQEEDLTTAYYRDHVLDFGEMLREQFYLAMPMRPLCGDDCKGLCPHCGTNLNVATCACDVRWQDPRLVGLQSLLRHPSQPGSAGRSKDKR